VDEHENGSPVEAARAQGEADARDGKPMDTNFWFRVDAVRKAYQQGYVSVADPPRARAPRPPRARKSTVPRKPVRIWKKP
jgi:hypothetical protein